MEGGISEEGGLGTQTSGKQFDIGEIRSWERRAGPPGDEFQMSARKDSVERRRPTPGALGSAQRRAVRKERAHSRQGTCSHQCPLPTATARATRGGCPWETPGCATAELSD